MTRSRPLFLASLFLALLGISLYIYWGLWNTFYQQDEWYTHGHQIIESLSTYFFRHYNYWHVFFGEGRILSRAFYSFFIHYFDFPMAPVAYLAITLHALNSFLVYLIGEKLTKDRLLAGLAALLFIANSVGQEAVTWMAASVGTLPAISLVLLAVYLFWHYLETERKIWLFLSFFLWFISIQFKEVGVAFIFLFPLIVWFWQQKGKVRGAIQKSWPFLLYGGVAVAFRLINLLLGTAERGSIHITGSGFTQTVSLNLIIYPVVGFFQSLIPTQLATRFIDWFLVVGHPYVYKVPIEWRGYLGPTPVMDFFSVVGGLLLLLLILFIHFQVAKKEERWSWRNYWFLIIWYGLSFAPVAILGRGGSYLDSRYYYLALVSISLLIAYLLTIFYNRGWLWRILGGLIIFNFLTIHIGIIRHGMSRLVTTSQERRMIFQTIEAAKPINSDHNIIYMTSDNNYYIKGNMLPMQQGTGYALMVWFYETGKIPATLLKEDWLWELGTEGYREIDGHGFGFFVTLDELKKTLANQQLSPTNVTAFSWSSQGKSLTNITEDIRLKLSQ